MTTERAELTELNELYREACEYFADDAGRVPVPPDRCLCGDELPPGGRLENYDLLSIRVAGTLIGYMAVYRDYPAVRVVGIPFIYIGEAARGAGFGQTVLRMIFRHFTSVGYGVIRAAVSLRNWGALRFFFRSGFRTVTDIQADGRECDGGSGRIVLERPLLDSASSLPEIFADM